MNISAYTIDSTQNHQCIIIGLGLIGRTIDHHLNQHHPKINHPPHTLDWNNPQTIIQAIDQILDQIKDDTTPTQLDLIWSAGRAQFLATEQDLAPEYHLYKTTLEHLTNRPKTTTTLNLISSAGGLYENTPHVTDLNDLSPSRPYAYHKLNQEKLLQQRNLPHRIYRVTSLYGPNHKNTQTGLINHLIHNTKTHQPTTIYAHQNTHRDYLYSHDLARFIHAEIKNQTQTKIHLLATGRSVSIHMLKNFIKNATNKTPKIIYTHHPTNAQNITYAHHLPPKTLPKTTLEEGIKLLAIH